MVHSTGENNIGLWLQNRNDNGRFDSSLLKQRHFFREHEAFLVLWILCGDKKILSFVIFFLYHFKYCIKAMHIQRHTCRGELAKPKILFSWNDILDAGLRLALNV